MKNKWLITKAILIILLTSIACSTKVRCPKFNFRVLDWLPYSIGDSILLINDSRDSTIILTINKIQIDHTTHYIPDLDCGTCDDRIEFNDVSDEIGNLHFELWLNDSNIALEEYFIMDTYFSNSVPNYHFHQFYTFNGDEYENVKVFKNISIDALFSTLIIAKDFGVVGLMDKDSVLWRFLNKVPREKKPKNYYINNISCE
jgi:hypothetical protein